MLKGHNVSYAVILGYISNPSMFCRRNQMPPHSYRNRELNNNDVQVSVQTLNWRRGDTFALTGCCERNLPAVLLTSGVVILPIPHQVATIATIQQQLYHSNYTIATIPQQLYHSNYTMVPMLYLLLQYYHLSTFPYKIGSLYVLNLVGIWPIKKAATEEDLYHCRATTKEFLR